MAKDSQTSGRLPRNFHRTFVPERQYINSMLHYAASGQSGDYQQISAVTGIPTGSSTGKVPAILDYCRGMSLVTLSQDSRSAVKRPQLTSFGRVVLLEDPHLKEPVTQWIAHLNLCSAKHGADVWYHIFYTEAQTLGARFARPKLEEVLALRYGTQRAGLIGPLVRMYEDTGAFSLCGALGEESGIICKKSAPLGPQYANGYGAWLAQLLSDNCPGKGQVTVTELEARAGWRTIPTWGLEDAQHALDLIERKGLVDVDRHMDPWLLRMNAAPDEVWQRLYDDLI